MVFAIRMATCRRRISSQGNIGAPTAATGVIPFHVAMALTWIAATGNATRPERYRRSFRQGVNSITVKDTDVRREAITIGIEPTGRC